MKNNLFSTEIVANENIKGFNIIVKKHVVGKVSNSADVRNAGRNIKVNVCEIIINGSTVYNAEGGILPMISDAKSKWSKTTVTQAVEKGLVSFGFIL